jgi:hypothetical protein
MRRCMQIRGVKMATNKIWKYVGNGKGALVIELPQHARRIFDVVWLIEVCMEIL